MTKVRVATLRALVFGVLVVVGAMADSSAQVLEQTVSEPDVPEKAGKELRAYRISGTPPTTDGRLDDEVWRLADAIDDLVQDEPDNMAAPTERTVVQVAYDDRYLYVAIQCFSADLADITAGLGRRDVFPPSDVVSISVDPRHDHLTGYIFRATPSGLQGDMSAYDDTRLDSDYDAVWELETGTTSTGWNAEFRIPFSQMRFTVPDAGRTVWGFQVRRDIQRRGEMIRWVGTPRGRPGFVSRFGHLIFDNPMTPPRRLELLPVVVGRLEDASSARVDTGVSGGLDMRVGLGTSATLSATINPDFGQVELDPAVLNLSVFETFYPEKRSFFIEDSRVFVLQFTQFPIFHSRRIGQTPGRIALKDDDELVHKPDQTTILGAMKITGKASGWTYGGLTALTSREYATVDTAVDGPEAGRRVERLVEPATAYSVGRLQRDLLHGTSTAGLIATAVVREQIPDAFTAGGDYNIRWRANRWNWYGHWYGTHAPISDVVRTGFGGSNNLSYSGKYLSAFTHADHFSSTFRNTDLGFMSTRPNKNEASGSVTVSQPDPWRKLRRISSFAGAGRQWNSDSVAFGKWVNVGLNGQSLNFWSFNVNATHNFDRLDDLDTRGGPPIVNPAGDNFGVFISSDSRKQWNGSLNMNGGRDAAGGHSVSLTPSVRVQPSDRLQASLGVTYTSGTNAAQWIANEDHDDTGTTDHVYGTLRQHVLSLTGRTTYAFTRDMTLDVFLQPFVAVGHYTDIRKLARPRSFEFEPVDYSDNPDFNRKSLRGNAVLRWEYIRGSTLFVAWSLSKSDTSRPGEFSALKDLGTAFGAEGTHVFLLKVTYWLTP